MHEAAITEALIEQVRGLMPAAGRLLSCRVEVGELEHIDPEVFATLWEVMTSETALRGAALEVDRIPLSVRCGACGLGFTPADRAVLVCPACGAVRPEILAGVGIVLRRLEIEEEP